MLLNPGISVIICCYNSAIRLPETIKYIAAQKVPASIPWEVIIVNNASLDDTTLVANTEFSKYHVLSGKFKIVEESKPGLSFARQKGSYEACYKYLIFCDDDNWLDPSYLHKAFIIMEMDPKIGALGGKSTAVTDDDQFPAWFEVKKNGFAVGAQSAVQGDVSQTCSLWGAGLVTQKQLFITSFSSKFPPILSDRKGNNLSSGGDTEYCYRLLLMGYKLFYNETLEFVHFISKERWSPEYSERIMKSCETGKLDSEELNKYCLLNKLVRTERYLKPLFIVKIFLGSLSTLFGRTSWSFNDSKILFYYFSQIDLGIDKNARDIYNFYKENYQRN